MKTKLTLSLDDKIIDRAKAYSRKKNRSLSDLVEEQLRNLVENNIVDQMTGILDKEFKKTNPKSPRNAKWDKKYGRSVR